MSKKIVTRIVTGVVGALIAGILLFYFTDKMNQSKLDEKSKSDIQLISNKLIESFIKGETDDVKPYLISSLDLKEFDGWENTIEKIYEDDGYPKHCILGPYIFPEWPYGDTENIIQCETYEIEFKGKPNEFLSKYMNVAEKDIFVLGVIGNNESKEPLIYFTIVYVKINSDWKIKSVRIER